MDYIEYKQYSFDDNLNEVTITNRNYDKNESLELNAIERKET